MKFFQNPNHHPEITLDEATSWHHSHYLAHTDNGPGATDRYTFTFKPFTGEEPAPSEPYDVLALLSSPEEDDNLQDRLHERNRIRAEVAQARRAWYLAGWTSRVTARLKQLAPLWETMRRHEAEMINTFTGLYATPDSHWRAALLSLATARDNATTAAEDFDTIAALVAGEYHNLDAEGHSAPDFAELLQDTGISLPGYHPRNLSYGSPDGWSRRRPSVERLTDVTKQQDILLLQVARLAVPVQN